MAPEPPPPVLFLNKREELNELLVDFLGSRNVYFQPDENIRMQYPAIVYEIDDQDAIYANNNPYRRQDAYQITLIDRNPDVPVRAKIETMRARFVRASVVDGLNHRIYFLYY